jgi:cobalt-zinc-cadmium efflux system protein
VWEAVSRLQDPPEVASGAMLVVAVLGLCVNIVAFGLLRRGAEASLNLEGAMLEVMADLVGSIGVIVAALLHSVAGWAHADAVFAAAIGVFILPRAYRLGRKALRILIQAAPDDLDLAAVEDALASIPGVVDVHDLHVWTLTSEMDIGSVHLMVTDTTDAHPVLDQARTLLSEDYGIAHATLQVEPESHSGCAELSY